MKLTLYPNGYAFISRNIIVQLNEGLNEIVVEDIPPHIDPHSLMFSFEETSDVIIRTYEFINNSETENPTPILNVVLEALYSGEYAMTFFYKVNKIAYEVFYNFLYDSIKETMSMYGWLEVGNYCGNDFKNLELQVVITQSNDNVIFTLDNIYDIQNGKKVNISFLSKNNVPVKHKFIVPFDKEIAVECIYMNNSDAFKLGTPLMAGSITLYFQDSDKSLQHIGDDKIDIYLPGDNIPFEIGRADDLVSVERKIVDDANVITLKNLTQEIIEVALEVNTFNQEVQQSNVVLEVDEDGIAEVVVKIMPLATFQVIYRIRGFEPPSTL